MFRSPEENRPDILVALSVGISDGLVVPFALTTALSRVFHYSFDIASYSFVGAVVFASAMGIANYYAAKHESAHYTQPIYLPNVQTELGLDDTSVKLVSGEMENEQREWGAMMQTHGMNSGQFNSTTQRRTALLITAGYIIGGLIPNVPYVFFQSVNRGLLASCVLTIIALFVFGFFKARLTSQQPWTGAARSVLIGCVSAAAAYLVAGVFV